MIMKIVRITAYTFLALLALLPAILLAFLIAMAWAMTPASFWEREP